MVTSFQLTAINPNTASEDRSSLMMNIISVLFGSIVLTNAYLTNVVKQRVKRAVSVSIAL